MPPRWDAVPKTAQNSRGTAPRLRGPAGHTARRARGACFGAFDGPTLGVDRGQIFGDASMLMNRFDSQALSASCRLKNKDGARQYQAVNPLRILVIAPVEEKLCWKDTDAPIGNGLWGFGHTGNCALSIWDETQAAPRTVQRRFAWRKEELHFCSRFEVSVTGSEVSTLRATRARYRLFHRPTLF